MLIIRELKSVFNTSIIIPQKYIFVNRIFKKRDRKTKFLYILSKCFKAIMLRMPEFNVDKFRPKNKNCAKCAKNKRYFAQKYYLQI